MKLRYIPNPFDALPAVPDIKTKSLPVTEVDLEHPYRVLLHNDDVTPMDFVVYVLRQIFETTNRSADKIMMEAHTNGIAHVVTIGYAEAKNRTDKAHSISRAAGYPLTFTIEPE